MSGMGNYIAAISYNNTSFGIQSLVGGTVSLEGEFTNAHSDDFMQDVKEDFFDIQDDQGKHTRLFWASNLLIPATGDRISVVGVRAYDGVIVNSLQVISPKEIQSAGSSSTVDSAMMAGIAKKVAVILINFTNNTSQPNTAADFRSAVFTNNNSANGYYKEVSRGKISLEGFNRPDGDIYGWYTIDYTNSPCNYYSWSEAARTMAQVDGFVKSNYTNIIYLFPRTSSCNWAGLGELGGDETWINYTSTMTYMQKVIMHEIGHNFNAHHASSYNCIDASSARVSISSNCTSSEYGDPFDVMGAATRSPWPYHFSNYHKGEAGWLDVSNVQETVTVSGDYILENPGQSSSGVQMLRIRRGGTNDYYYLEYRRPYGIFDAFNASDPAVNGISIRLAPDYSFTQTKLIDMTPATIGFNDAALALNQTFYDSVRQIRITNLNMSTTSATVRIKFDDITPPSVNIIKPLYHHTYVNDFDSGVDPDPTGLINKPVSSGRLTIDVAASDTMSGMNTVKFYIDGVLRNTDSISPYKWTWTPEVDESGDKTILVQAMDAAGNTAEQSINVVVVAVPSQPFITPN